MNKLKNASPFLFHTLLFFSFLLSSQVLLAQEDGPDPDAIAKEEMECDKNKILNQIVNVSSFCSDAATEAEAIEEYQEHLDKAAGRYVTCLVDCEKEETCTPVFISWKYVGVMPEPQTGHPGCSGFYFTAVRDYARGGCTPCKKKKKKKDAEERMAFDLSEEESETADSELTEEVWEVFPNPADEEINIEVSTKEALAQLSVTFYSIDGKVVMDHDLGQVIEGTHRLRFDATKLETGLYIMTLSNGNRLLKTAKVSINR